MFRNKNWKELISDLIFWPVRGYEDLFVSDVSDEDTNILILMGCEVDTTVSTNLETVGERTRILYRDGGIYNIVEITYANIKYPK